MRWLGKKNKEEGPFKANRILNTKELKIDQVFTRDGEKPVALFTHAKEREGQKIDAKGFVGPVGGQVGYATSKEGVTRGFYFADNISETELKESRKGILAAANKTGNAIPKDVVFEKIEKENSIPITKSTLLTATSSGSVGISGSFVVSGSARDLWKPLKICSYCGKRVENEAGSEYCSYCGKHLEANYS